MSNISPLPSNWLLMGTHPVPLRRKPWRLPAGSLLRRFLVLLMVWQSAAPVCHVHGGLQAGSHSSSATERIGLALHLRAHHGNPSDLPLEDHDWHVHFGQSSEVVPACQVERAGTPDGLSAGHLLCSDRLCPHVSSAGCLIMLPGIIEQAPAGFYSEFGRHLAFPLRLCVARC